MADSIDRTPDPRRYATKAEELSRKAQEAKHDDEIFDGETNKFVLGVTAAGLLGVAGALAVRRLNRKKKEEQ